MYFDHEYIIVETGDKFEDVADTIVKNTHRLYGTDMLVVKNFGLYQDLELHICKDGDYDPGKSEEYSDLVDIETKKNGKAVDDAVGIYVTDGQLYHELERIYLEKDMRLI